jgi:hypothetical protein
MTPRKNEGIKALGDFISGERSYITRWCDWEIPIRMGVASDPFPRIDRTLKLAQRALVHLQETAYPVIISTKSDLLWDDVYIELLAHTNCVLQVSACSTAFDEVEQTQGYEQRIKMVGNLCASIQRVIIRVQPYIPALKSFLVSEALSRYKEMGIYGIIVEGLHVRDYDKAKGLPVLDKERCYSDRTWRIRYNILKEDFIEIKEYCHQLGLRFLCGEEDLRELSDEPCCCGTAGLPRFDNNTANINHLPIHFTKRMRDGNTGEVFRDAIKEAYWHEFCKLHSYRHIVNTLLDDNRINRHKAKSISLAEMGSKQLNTGNGSNQ